MYAQTRVPGSKGGVCMHLRAEVLWAMEAALQTNTAVLAESLSGEVAPLDGRQTSSFKKRNSTLGKIMVSR